MQKYEIHAKNMKNTTRSVVSINTGSTKKKLKCFHAASHGATSSVGAGLPWARLARSSLTEENALAPFTFDPHGDLYQH